MLNSIRIHTSRLSLEAYSGADIKQLIANTFDPLVKEVTGYINTFLSNSPGISSTINKNNFIKDIKKHPYLDISPLAAFVPEGLNTTYLKYSNELVSSSEHASHILSNILNEYSLFLSKIINNKDEILSTKLFNKTYTKLAGEREKLNVAVGTCFKRGSTKSEVSIGDVISRNNDWELVFKNIDVMTNFINSVDRNALNKKIKECSDLLDIILAKIKRHELDVATPEVVRNLSDGAYSVAQELEFFSITYYKVIAFVTAVERTAKHFNKVFDK